MSHNNIRYFGAKIWSKVPVEIRQAPSLEMFKEVVNLSLCPKYPTAKNTAYKHGYRLLDTLHLVIFSHISMHRFI